MSSIIEKVRPMVESVVEDKECYLVDIEYLKEGPHWYLRVYADKLGGIDINDCALISEELSEKLDSLTPDPFPKAYFLEVSSPGAERPLKTEADIQRAVGSFIHLDYYVPVAGEKFHQGFLKDVNQETVIIEIKEKTQIKELEVKRKEISKIRLAIQF